MRRKKRGIMITAQDIIKIIDNRLVTFGVHPLLAAKGGNSPSGRLAAASAPFERLNRLSFMQGSGANSMIRKISIIVIDGLPWQFKEHALPGTTWIRFNAEQPEMDAVYVRMFPLGDDRDWWMVVRLCGEPCSVEEYLGRPAKAILSYRPQHGKTLTRQEYFSLLDNGIEEYFEQHGNVFPFVLNWAVAAMGDDRKREKCVNIMQTSDFFMSDSLPYLVRLVDCEEEHKEVALLAKRYDPLCAGVLHKKKFNEILHGDGCLLVVYPMRNSSKERIPIIGYIAIKVQRKTNTPLTVMVFSIVVNPQFRRSGIGTLLLDRARRTYSSSSFLALVPLTDGYNEMLLFLKQYGSTSKVLDAQRADTRLQRPDVSTGNRGAICSANCGAVSTGNFEVVEFNIPPLTDDLKLGIVGLSSTPP